MDQVSDAIPSALVTQRMVEAVVSQMAAACVGGAGLDLMHDTSKVIG